MSDDFDLWRDRPWMRPRNSWEARVDGCAMLAGACGFVAAGLGVVLVIIAAGLWWLAGVYLDPELVINATFYGAILITAFWTWWEWRKEDVDTPD